MTSPVMSNPKHDAESRLDSIDFHLKGLRDLIASTAVLPAPVQPAPVPPVAAPLGDPSERFEQTVLATFGGWVLKELAVEGLDVTDKVRAAHDILSERLGLRDREPGPERAPEETPDGEGLELFSPEDLDVREEELDVSPIEIRGEARRSDPFNDSDS